MTERPPFPFVVGCERSGTTLLRLILDAHPELAVPPESYFIVDLYRSHGRSAHGRVDVEAMAADLEANRWFRAWDLPEGEAARILGSERDEGADAADGLDFAGAVRRVYSRYAELHGKPRYGDKTPAYVQHIRLLAQVFPEARFVHLIRDGRDVAMSLAEVRWGPGDVLDAALQWAERVSRGREAGHQVGAHRYLEVRYERLVADPEPLLREVAEFCGLSFDGAMARHPERAAERIPQRPEALHRRAATAPSATGRDWRRDMAGDDLAAVEALIGGALAELGYERGVPHVPTEAARRARAAVARRRRRHFVRRMKLYLRGERRVEGP